MLELIGQEIDRYQLIDFLGDDRWGGAYKAYDPKFERTVTIQVFLPQTTKEPDLGEHVIHVARTVLTWRHTGIARVFGFGKGTFPGFEIPVTYLVREYIPGSNLGELLQDLHEKDQWIPIPEAVYLVYQVSLALQYAHRRGIFHGIIHPQNIYIIDEPTESYPYQPVLINLGFLKPGLSVNISTGTPYVSPDVLGGNPIKASDDIYSLGVLLHELCTGKLPSVNQMTDDEQDRSDPFTRLSTLQSHPDLPDSLAELIIQAMDYISGNKVLDLETLIDKLNDIASEVSGRGSVPPGVREAASLMSAYQSSLERTSKAPYKPKPPSIDFSQDKIHILEPDKSIRVVHMKSEGLTVGRSADNDILLDHSSVSRRHARLDFDGKDYKVSDLNSLNGTYLEDFRIPADTPQVWNPGDNLRIGEIWLRLERAEQSTSTLAMETKATQVKQPGSIDETVVMFSRPDGTSIENSQIKFSPGESWVGAFLDTQNISVSPGERVTASIFIFNRGPDQDTFNISILGIPRDWTPYHTQGIIVPPGDQKEVRLTFKPPRTPSAKAGRHRISINISSINAPQKIGIEQIVELRLVLTIAAFSHFRSEIRPTELTTNELGQVHVQNQGNHPETYNILWEDLEQRLTFDPPYLKISVPPGKSAIIEFRASLNNTHWFGGERAFPFNIHISTQAGQSRIHTAEIASQGLIPAWAPAALFSLCAVMACVVFLFYNQLSSPAKFAKQTADADRTAIALIENETRISITGTADTITGSSQATIQAATATAVWLSDDDDQDGLNNSLELQSNTKPDVPDTDEDELSDGDEVILWKTNPIVADTDGDGLKDGVEVEMGTNPLKKDTDDDGIDDAIDTEPANKPTQMPNPSLTLSISPTLNFTSTRTSTPTLTLTPKVTSADLSISLSNNQASSTPGANLTYTIVVTNKGPSDVAGAQVIDMFPSSMLNLTWTCSATAGSNCERANGIGNIDVHVDLIANGTATFIASGLLSPNASSLLINNASVIAPLGITELNTVNNLSIDTDTLTPRVSFSFSKTDHRTTIHPSEPVTYTIAATNNGPSAVSGVQISDSFSGKLSGIIWECSSTPGSSCISAGSHTGDINTTVNLVPGGTATFIAKGTVKSAATGSLTNTAALSSPIDPITNNKTASDTTTIIPLADIEIAVQAPVSVTTSSQITYTITVTNTGPSIATGVELSNLLPSGSVFISASPGVPDCTHTVGEVRCDLGDLVPGTSTVVEIVVKAPAFPGNTSNEAQAAANQADPVPENNAVTTEVLVN